MKGIVTLLLIVAIFSGVVLKTSNASYPGDCSFTNGDNCGYTIIPQDWKWGIIMSSSMRDHTTNSTFGGFLEIDDYETENTAARLHSPKLEAMGQRQQCLTFWFKYIGNSIKEFRVIQENDPGTITGGNMIWNASERTGPNWQYAQLPIMSEVPYVIHFEAIRRVQKVTRDDNFVDVDDVMLKNGPCAIFPENAKTNYTAELPPRQIKQIPIPYSHSPNNCTFNKNNLCSWKQSKDNTLKWSIKKGPTDLARYTGPKTDNPNGPGKGKGYYAYISVSNKDYGKAARLESPDLSPKTSRCLTFWYHMWGTRVNTLNVYLKSGNTNSTVWTRKKSQGLNWLRADVNLEMMNDNFQIIFEAIADSSSQLCIIALDDISLSKEDCPADYDSCDFEISNCYYTSAGASVWDLTGKHYSKSALIDKDHTYNSDYGHYYQLNTTKVEIYEQNTLISPHIELAISKCLKFWYYMKGGQKSTIFVNTNHDNSVLFDSTPFSHFYGHWQPAQMSLKPTDRYPRLQFVTTITKKTDVIAIDDIEITNGTCTRPGECNFEDGDLCTWYNDPNDDFDWQLQNGETISKGTGPKADRTFGTDSGTYLYIETSKPQHFRDRARLYSQGFEQSEIASKCLQIWYNMIGNDIGRLTIYQHFQDGSEVPLWQLNGDQGYDGNTEWHYGQIPFTANKASYRLVIEATVGGELGDIAIDDLMVTDDLCSMMPSTANNTIALPPIITTPQPETEELYRVLDCNFKTDICNWTNVNTTIDNNWIVANQSNIPQYKPSGESYAYSQIDAFSDNKDGVIFTLQSPKLKTKITDTQMCFSFLYYMFGPHRAELTLYVDIFNDDKKEAEKFIHWKKSQYSIDKWQQASVSIQLPDKLFRLRFEANITYGNVVAVRHFRLIMSDCMETEKICDFTFDACDWKTDIESPISWDIVRAKDVAKGPSIDHTSLTADGAFAYIENNALPPHAGFISPKYSKFIGTQCLSFWYYMSGAGDGTLGVQVRTEAEENATVDTGFLWHRVGDRGQRWHRGQTYISIYEDFQIIFFANFTTTNKGYYIAIDDIDMIPGECEMAGTCRFDEDFCGFTNDMNEMTNWMIGRGKTYHPRYISGPVVDADGNGLYAYMDYTLGIWNDQPTTRLRSEAMAGSLESRTFCLAFSYVQFGEMVSKLQVFLDRLDKTEGLEILLWEAPQDSEFVMFTHWNRATVVFNCSVEFVILFEATDISSLRTFIGIDNVTITPGSDCNAVEPKENIIEKQDEMHRCDFEGGNMCSWIPDEKFNHWVPSYGLAKQGAPFDHTKKTNKGFYATPEVWHQSFAPNFTRMVTNATIHDFRSACFQFWYYAIKPSNLRSYVLQIILRTPDNNEVSIWNTTITVGGSWQFGQVDISNVIDYKIILQSFTPVNDRGYISVDDIVLLMSECPEERICSFDHGMCGFSQPITNTLNWQITEGLKLGNFPSDHTTGTRNGNYIYLNTTLRVKNPHATLLSPVIPPGQHCIHFWYCTTYTDTKLIIKAVTSNTEKLLSTFGSISQSMWLSASVEADNSAKFQIAFTVIPGTRESNMEIAIDDIEFTNGSCSSRDFCDFEQGFCNWQSGKDVFFQWTRKAGYDVEKSKGFSLSDHTLGLPNGNFLLLDFEYALGDTEDLFSPVLDPAYKCFSFWYFASHIGIGNFSVRKYSSRSVLTIATITIPDARDWNQVMINTNSTDIPYEDLNYMLGLRFTAKKRNAFLLIDDIFFDTKYCEFSEVNTMAHPMCDYTNKTANCGNCDFETGNCGYTDTSSDQMHWRRGNQSEAKTFTYNEIDVADHTSGKDSGKFMYTAALSWIVRGGAAQLYSPRIKFASATCHMTFWLYLTPAVAAYSEPVTVSIVYMTGDVPLELDRILGVSGQWTWFPIYIGHVNQPFRIEFKTGSKYPSTVAVDDIEMIDCGPPTQEYEKCGESQFRCNSQAKSACVTASQICDFNDDCGNGRDEQHCEIKNYTKCDFEKGSLCVWKNDDNSYWSITDASTRFIDRDHTTNSRRGYYLVAAIFGEPRRINSATFKAGNCTMRFHYVMNGVTAQQFKLLTVTATEPEKVWFYRNRHWGNYFHRDEVTFNMQSDFMIIMEATTSWGGFVAVDDISFDPNCIPAEKDLDSTAPKMCKEGQFRCDGSKCFEQSLVCNFNIDCDDKTDELNCGVCDFESGSCGWSDSGVGVYRWQRLEASFMGTPSTAPIKDHTNNSLSGWYMAVVKTPNAHSVMSNVYLESPILGLTATTCKFTFAYHTVNADGILEVNVRNFKERLEKTVAILKESGNQSWTVVTIPLGRLKPGSQVVLEADVKQTHFQGFMPDFVIDDTNFINCSAINETKNPTHTNLSCSFEHGSTCHWYQEHVRDEADWEIGTALTNGTGSESDHTNSGAGHYLYVKSITSDYSSVQTAWLVSPILPAANKSTCLRFWYHMFGPIVGPIGVSVIHDVNKEYLHSNNDIWVQYNQEHNEWLPAAVNVDPQSGNFQIIIWGTVDPNYPHILAIDDVEYSKAQCGSGTYEYNFETNNGGWVGTTSTTSRGWELFRMNRMYGVYDHTTDAPFGRALYYYTYEQSSAVVSNPTAFYSSVKNGSCFQFWYMMSDTINANITATATYNKVKLSQMYMVTKRYRWHYGQLSIPPNIQFQIEFTAGATDFSNKEYDFYLDDFIIRNQTCLPDGSCDFESSMCGWTAIYRDNRLKWLQSIANTPSKMGGPGEDSTGNKQGFYLFLDSSMGMIGTADITSPELTSKDGAGCFSFNYHMTGENVGSLSVVVRLSNIGKEDIFQVNGSMQNKWIPVHLEVHNLTTSYFIDIHGELIGGTGEYIAIDNFTITPGSCPQNFISKIQIQ